MLSLCAFIIQISFHNKQVILFHSLIQDIVLREWHPGLFLEPRGNVVKRIRTWNTVKAKM